MAESDPKIDPNSAELAYETAPADPDLAVEAAKPKRKWGRLALMLSLPLALIIGGVVYWHGLQGEVSTDNAYVHLDKVSVSSEEIGRASCRERVCVPV